MRYMICRKGRMILDGHAAKIFNYGIGIDELFTTADLHREHYTEEDAAATVVWLNERQLGYPVPLRLRTLY